MKPRKTQEDLVRLLCFKKQAISLTERKKKRKKKKRQKKRRRRKLESLSTLSVISSQGLYSCALSAVSPF
jgi:hypothetical protein